MKQDSKSPWKSSENMVQGISFSEIPNKDEPRRWLFLLI
jgi:hypothetical protein